jgi:hypothetical protein
LLFPPSCLSVFIINIIFIFIFIFIFFMFAFSSRLIRTFSLPLSIVASRQVEDLAGDLAPFTVRWSWILWYRDSDTCSDHGHEWFQACAVEGSPTCQLLHATKARKDGAVAAPLSSLSPSPTKEQILPPAPPHPHARTPVADFTTKHPLISFEFAPSPHPPPSPTRQVGSDPSVPRDRVAKEVLKWNRRAAKNGNGQAGVKVQPRVMARPLLSSSAQFLFPTRVALWLIFQALVCFQSYRVIFLSCPFVLFYSTLSRWRARTSKRFRRRSRSALRKPSGTSSGP